MALIKNEIPILEYDTAQEAIIMPGHSWDYEKMSKAAAVLAQADILRMKTWRR